jgi:hypothetical protein
MEELNQILEKEIDEEIERAFANPKDYSWKPLDLTNFLKMTLEQSCSNPFDKRGEENGVKWHVWYENGWNVEAEKNGVTKSTSWPGYEPRLGVDISDSQKIEETLEKYITNFKDQ